MQRVSRVLLRDRAYEEIREAIVDGALAPGEVIRDLDLAERLGLSRAPVREALARLTEEGLVESKPQSWTRVTPLVLRDVRDALAVVRAMHELAVREAVPRMAPAHVKRMRVANARFGAAIRNGDVAAALEADDAVHDVCIEVSSNRALAATVERCMPLIRRLERQRFATLPGRQSVRQHDRLIRACAAGDVEQAVAVTTAIWSALADLIESAESDAEPTGGRHVAR